MIGDESQGCRPWQCSGAEHDAGEALASWLVDDNGTLLPTDPVNPIHPMRYDGCR